MLIESKAKISVIFLITSSKTGLISKDRLAAVVTSCSAARSRLPASRSWNSRAFSMAITAWSAKVSSSLICASVNGRTSSAADMNAPDRLTVSEAAGLRVPFGRRPRDRKPVRRDTRLPQREGHGHAPFPGRQPPGRAAYCGLAVRSRQWQTRSGSSRSATRRNNDRLPSGGPKHRRHRTIAPHSQRWHPSRIGDHREPCDHAQNLAGGVLLLKSVGEFALQMTEFEPAF